MKYVDLLSELIAREGGYDVEWVKGIWGRIEEVFPPPSSVKFGLHTEMPAEFENKERQDIQFGNGSTATYVRIMAANLRELARQENGFRKGKKATDD